MTGYLDEIEEIRMQIDHWLTSKMADTSKMMATIHLVSIGPIILFRVGTLVFSKICGTNLHSRRKITSLLRGID